MASLETDRLAKCISACFALAGDGRLSQAERTKMSVSAKRMRGRLIDLLSAKFESDLQEIDDANSMLEAVTQRVENATEAINKIADTVKQITGLIGVLDKLVGLAAGFH